MRGINWWPVSSPHKGPVTRKMFPFDDVTMRKPRAQLCTQLSHAEFTTAKVWRLWYRKVSSRNASVSRRTSCHPPKSKKRSTNKKQKIPWDPIRHVSWKFQNPCTTPPASVYLQRVGFWHRNAFQRKLDCAMKTKLSSGFRKLFV